MDKVVRVDMKGVSTGKKYSNLRNVNNSLAKSRKLVDPIGQPKRKEYQKMIMHLSNSRYKDRMKSGFAISEKDIKRLECPSKGEIPMNTFDILEIIVSEIKIDPTAFNATYDVNPSCENDIVSVYLIGSIIQLMEILMHRLALSCAQHDEENPPIFLEKYKEASEYFMEMLKDFDKRYPGIFTALISA